MKQIYRFIALIVLCSLSGPDLMAQITPQRILGTFLLKDSVYNFEFLKSSEDKFTFKVTGTRDNKTVEKNDSTNDNQNLAELPSTVDEAQSDFTVYLSEFNKEIFIVSFGKLMRDKFKVPTLDSKDKATEVFFKILARLGFIDDEPVTAYLILKQDSIRSFLRVNQSAYYNSILSWPYVMHTVELVNVETEDGAIKNVSAHLTPLPGGKSNPRQFLEFKNQSPISISGKFDADKFAHVKLYCNNCAGVEGLSRYIKLSELLALDIVYENDKEDYSPSNKTIALSHNQPLVELRKEQRSKILEIAAFSDFVGLDQEEPNGLVQIEARRRLNINTKSYRFKSTSGFEDLLNRYNVRDVIILSKKDSATNKYIGYNVYKRLDSSLIESISTKSIKQRESFYGYLTYFEPRLLFAKLEGNRRLVDSSKINNGRLDPVSVFQQQLVSFGINLQVLRFSYPQ
ncbi:MAG TPA: hypothetical protein VK616_07095, partial [Flavitalea sp.]|nr:hypothetical protein [Flavitalea sp.]